MKWEAHEWVMVILALSVLVCISQPTIIRITTGQALSDNSASVINTYTQSVGLGLLLLLSKKILGKDEK